ncbi:serine/threonine-protein kinase [Streptomyces beijiangensis]|uniref:non-specific serine/threonine protein kinase n=1 Tax=Streptomyces beijiangensis TaxID=163361 RepID=A0A939JDR1_9ACTN|nr:serine/threonine-protein kinase [Streptomyces beijiangensis]MBO0510543.1 serine/threonine protein kinase [Streptomyces beijiangensis]
MTNDGGRANEPTSYGLRPPEPNGAQVPPQNSAAYEPTQVAQAPHDPDAGRLIGGRYRLLSRLGHGGMGTVWRAHDEVVDRDVAIKEPRLPDNLPARERENVYLRMQREARAAARIDHPSVVTMHDVVIEDAKPWIVMELVRGHSLGDRLQEGTLDVREAARIGLAVLGALTAAHEAGVLHRDVKPDNVLLGRGDRVVLTDFGIAQVEGEQGLTETGAFVGSPEYISPERVLGQRPGPESDLWSLGVVLYAAVEGVSPYRRSHTPSTLQAVLSAEPQTPARGSGAFGTLVMRLLRKNPAERPSSAEIRETLESVARPPAAASLAETQLYGSTGATGATGATGTSVWVPPVLHRNRKAQYGLGVAVLAIAVALVLIFANPFGGGGTPAGFLVRPESEVLKADIAVPKDYARVEVSNTSESNVTYYDPSDVFYIFVERVDLATAAKDTLDAKGDTWKSYYEKGGKYGTELDKPKVSLKEVDHQGQKASELVTDYEDTSPASNNPVGHRFHELIVPGKNDGRTYWRLRVAGPSDGWAAKEGDKLFSEVVAHFEINQL